jgi:hypothetical protein
MKGTIYILLALVGSMGLNRVKAQNAANWTAKDLMAPAVLAGKIKSGKDIPIIYCVGPGTVIPGSVAIGMTSIPEKLDKFKNTLSSVPKNAAIVIYCGCCPFSHCPNVRPAVALLKEMKFTNFKLLDLPLNIRTDWIAQGYPTIKE